ncbi:glutathione peroxidase [Jiulongibacter sediminis]|uniref:Glutathione peroxidase n=2 Tax=Jiulongibacter sediminis TaxID=1605367 RepID=A0A0P7C215_9BACT|nr:glutathione peroxidase [Jiulongibacter sediminis]KPM48066.1 glutathione peroxidase [Jiulongibacter sediminis]TBX24247.1 glutathione peroxidase [Jiulongibacter sediminis]
MKIVAAIVLAVLAVLALMNFTTIKNVLSNKRAMNIIPASSLANGSLYDYKMESLEGEEIDLSQYKGKKVVLLNVASKCGFTPQYADWQKFHEEHGEDIVVLGFPANNFGGQEPGSDEEIGEFCQKNYGVTFQMFSKIDVIGDNQHPLYKWLSSKELNGWNDKAPTWNFCKYVVNEDGQVTHFFASKIKPEDAEFKAAVGI